MKLRVSVNFIVEEVYDFEVDDADYDDEERFIEQAKENLLSDMGLEEWQGDWATSYVSWGD